MLLRQRVIAWLNLLGGVLAVGNASDCFLRREQVDRIAVMVDQLTPSASRPCNGRGAVHRQPVIDGLLDRHELAPTMH